MIIRGYTDKQNTISLIILKLYQLRKPPIILYMQFNKSLNSFSLLTESCRLYKFFLAVVNFLNNIAASFHFSFLCSSLSMQQLNCRKLPSNFISFTMEEQCQYGGVQAPTRSLDYVIVGAIATCMH